MTNTHYTSDSPVETDLATILTRLSAARAGYLDYLDDINDALKHPTFVFPGDTDLTCTFTAGQPADTFGAWAEIVDSGATTLSSLFSAAPGHITVIQEEEVSDQNTRYQLEIAYGDAKTHITSQRFAGSGKFQSPDNHARVFGTEIPAGETVYYRMKSNTAVADTTTLHLRYHTH